MGNCAAVIERVSYTERRLTDLGAGLSMSPLEGEADMPEPGIVYKRPKMIEVFVTLREGT